jgi:hypothetical protein
MRNLRRVEYMHAIADIRNLTCKYQLLTDWI